MITLVLVDTRSKSALGNNSQSHQVIISNGSKTTAGVTTENMYFFNSELLTNLSVLKLTLVTCG